MSSLNPPSSLSLEQLRQAIALKEQIASLESQLAGVLGGSAAGSAAPEPAFAPAAVPVRRGRGGPRVMSPAARARIAIAQKARWAKFHAEHGAPAKSAKAGPAPASAGTGSMSREERGRLGALARWAKVRGTKAAPAPVKAAKAPGQRFMSAEGRARIAAAAKARWARFRREKNRK